MKYACILRFPLRRALVDKPMLMDEIGREVRLLEADVPAGKSAIYVIDKVRALWDLGQV